MVWFKSCPRCAKGDMAFEADEEDSRIRCVQCGYSKYVANSYQAALVVEESAPQRELVGELAL